jgi:methylenetetrahydrofolate reductase (NADPH)
METASDPIAEGSTIALELIEQIASIRGIAGVHIMAPGNDAAIPDTIEAARAKVKSATR